MSLFYDYNKFNPKYIQFKTPVNRLIDGIQCFFIPMRHKNQDIYIKTPKIIVPFGLNMSINNNNQKTYSYVLSFDDSDIDSRIANFLQFVQNIETLCRSVVKNNMDKWGVTYSYESLNFKSLLKDDQQRCCQLMRLKITHNVTEIYDEKGILQDNANIEHLVTNYCHIISLIEISNIWLNSSEFGLTFRVRQMKVYPPTRPIGGVSLLDETVNIVENLPPVPPPLPSVPLIGHLNIPMANCCALITAGNFNLNKVEPLKHKKHTASLQPKIDLEEILKIRNNLRSNRDAQNI